MWLRDTGVLGKMKDDELYAPMPIPDPKIRVDQSISIEQIGIGIAIYSVGITLSLFFFIGELCAKKKVMGVEKTHRRQRKTIQEPQHEGKTGQDIIMAPKMGLQIVSHV